MIINHVKKLTDYRFVNLFSAQYTDRKANEKEWIFASRKPDADMLQNHKDRPDAVVIVPLHDNDEKLVLIKEYRVALGGIQYGFPAGLLDPGETVEQAGKRELFEETGLTVTEVLRISPPVYSSSGLSDESVSMMFVRCTGQITNQHNEASEEIEPICLTSKDAARILYDKEIQYDVKTWIVLRGFADTGQI